jgi:hypothetical protein
LKAPEEAGFFLDAGVLEGILEAAKRGEREAGVNLASLCRFGKKKHVIYCNVDFGASL